MTLRLSTLAGETAMLSDARDVRGHARERRVWLSSVHDSGCVACRVATVTEGNVGSHQQRWVWDTSRPVGPFGRIRSRPDVLTPSRNKRVISSRPSLFVCGISHILPVPRLVAEPALAVGVLR